MKPKKDPWVIYQFVLENDMEKCEDMYVISCLFEVSCINKNKLLLEIEIFYLMW